MKKFSLLILLIFLAFSFSLPAISEGSTKLKANTKFNKLVYDPNDQVSIGVDLKPVADIKDVRVSLKIGEKDHYTYSRTHYLGNMTKGEKQTITFDKNSANNFGLKLGSNPIAISITEEKKSIYKLSTSVGLRSSTSKGKIALSLAVNISDKPRLNTDNNVSDTFVQKSLLNILGQYAGVSSKNKGYVNFIFSPILADTIHKISSGYTLVENEDTRFVPATSPSSLKAKKILETYQKLFQSKTSSLISSTYTQADARYLKPADFANQVVLGNATLKRVFNQKSLLVYPQGGNLYYGQKLKSDNGYIANHTNSNASYIKATKTLLKKNKDKESTIIEALAQLTEESTKNNNDLVLITSQMVDPSTLSLFIREAKKQNWITFKPLDALKDSKSKTSVSKKTQKRRSDQLSKARAKYYLLKKALDSENSSFNLAKMAIYLAEDSNFDDPQSEILADKANDILEKELKKIVLRLSPLTLTGREGKLPVRIINNTNSKLNFYIVTKTDGLEIKNDKKFITINPKENVLSMPVKVIKGGRHKVLVQLKVDGQTITQEHFFVSTNLPDIFWYYVGLIAALFLLLILGAFYVRERRSKASA